MKTVLITGASDGLGLATAARLLAQGHCVLLHGRSATKLASVANSLSQYGDRVETYVADLADLTSIAGLAEAISTRHTAIDALINNAGVFKLADPSTASGIDVRLVVNTIAPYLLTRILLPVMAANGRVVNISSAAQTPLNWRGLKEKARYSDAMQAYAESKFATTCWTLALANREKGDVSYVSLNPGSLLATKMVQEGFGIAGNQVDRGAVLVADAAVGESFAGVTGKYFDNDSERFANPLPQASNPQYQAKLLATLEAIGQQFS